MNATTQTNNTTEERLRRIQERQNANLDGIRRDDLPEGITIGYVGNCGHDYDDRAWFIFRKTGKVGTHADRIGGFSTEQRGKLLPLLRAVEFAIEHRTS